MWNPFAPKPAAKPVDTITRAEHRAVVDALNEEVIRLRTERNNARSARDAAERRAGEQKHRAIVSGRLASEFQGERDAARHILRAINGMVTPACAGIGRKMAAKAREGLPEFAGQREAA